MNCKTCGSPIMDGAAFCLNCGAKVEAQEDATVMVGNTAPQAPAAPQQPAYTPAPQQPAYTPAPQQPAYTPAPQSPAYDPYGYQPQPEPKKGKGKLIAIICGAVALIAVVTVVLILVLGGSSVEGKWVAEYDYTDEFFDNAVGEGVIENRPELTVSVTFEFKDNGKFKMALDKEDYAADMKNVLETIIDYYVEETGYSEDTVVSMLFGGQDIDSYIEATMEDNDFEKSGTYTQDGDKLKLDPEEGDKKTVTIEDDSFTFEHEGKELTFKKQ